MSALLLLIACLVLGACIARFAKPPPSLAQNLNWWVLNVALSSLVLQLIPQLEFDWHLWFPIVALWFVFLGAWGFFIILGRLLNWSRQRIGALTLVGGLCNTSFVGFPLIEWLRGQEGLTVALIADQAGGFIALAVGGPIVAAIYSGGKVEPAAIAKKVLLFPPFVSLFIGIAVGLAGGWPAEIDSVLARLGSTLVPIALFSVGLQFRLTLQKGELPAMSIALAWKLLLAPAIVYLAGTAIGIEGPVFAVAVLQSAMAPMISSAIIADQNNLDPKLANMVLGVGILVSFISVPLIDSLL